MGRGHRCRHGCVIVAVQHFLWRAVDQNGDLNGVVLRVGA
jgi:hypothetical protein